MSTPTNFKPITDPSIATYSSPNVDDVFHVVDVSDTTDSAAGTSKRGKLDDVLSLATLQKVSDTGGLDNGSTIRQGLIPHGFGGGISRVCANSKEDQWEDGFRYLIVTTGSTNTVVYAETINYVIPDDTYDETDDWAVGSRFKNLVSGVEYICTQANEGDAVWQAQSGTFTSTLSNPEDAVTSVFSATNCFFSVSGNVVTVTINGSIEVDFSILNTGSFVFTRPIPTSTSTSFGVVNLNQSNQVNGIVSGNRIRLNSNDTSFIGTVEFTATFQYLIS